MQVVMAIQDYISHDPKVNQFIKSLSEDEADEINRYIEENFSDGTLYLNDLEDGCLNGEFNAVLVKQGLREADSNDLVNVCLVSSDFEDTASDLFDKKDIIINNTPSLGVEDFAYFANAVPSCFYNLGIRNDEKGIVYPGHNNKFDVDEESIYHGVALQTLATIKWLNN